MKEPDIAPRLLLDNVPLKLDKQRWQLTPASENGRCGHHHRLSENIREGKALTLRGGKQVISLAGLKAALLFIDAQQKRVGSETAWIKKGDDPPLSVPPAPALKRWRSLILPQHRFPMPN